MRFEDFWKGGSEPMTLSEIPLCSVGRKWVYIFNRRRAKKLIPDNNSIIDLSERRYEAATCCQLETKNLGHPRYGNVGS